MTFTIQGKSFGPFGMEWTGNDFRRTFDPDFTTRQTVTMDVTVVAYDAAQAQSLPGGNKVQISAECPVG